MIGDMLTVRDLDHVQRIFPAVTGIRRNPDLVENDPCVFGGDLFVVDNQHAHVLRLDISGRRAVTVAVIERKDDCAFRPIQTVPITRIAITIRMPITAI